jgi:hypothetical protein
LSRATTNADGVTVRPNFADTDPEDYPMPMVTYVTAPTSKVYEGRGITLRKFLTYAVGDAQTTLPDGYVPLSSAMVQQTQDAIGKIPTSTAPAPGSGGGSPYPTGNPGGSGVVPTGSSYVPTGGVGPAPDGNVGGDGVNPAGCGDNCPTAAAAELPVGTFELAASRLVLPGILVLSLLGIIGGLALLGGMPRRLSIPRLRP